jgi:succinate dehydrogenase/fumarate reductase cytochrome b subunit
MDQVNTPAADLPPERTQETRKQALVDLVYLLLLVGLYAVSLLHPLAGIILGIVLTSSGETERIRKTGRVCLILGVVNLVLVLLAAAIAIAASGFMLHLPFSDWS